jgi:phosphoribosylamine---glycine ligase
VRVLVVGSGGREHALCWKIRQSPRCEAVYCAPGNGGTGEVAELLPIPVSDKDALAEWAHSNRIDLTVIGPDDPLADGIVDRFRAAGLRVFGPTQAAAEIEWSKVWAKQFFATQNIPTAASASFDEPQPAHRYVDQQRGELVVKADGLALGKGVFVCSNAAEAHAAIDQVMVAGQVGAAGRRIVIEERLRGREVSVMAICDGRSYRLLPTSCDHKAAYDGDRGPNTGGMGAYSPAVWLSDAQLAEIEARAIAPAVAGLARMGRPFTGFLYCGAMITPAGLRVLEFNARLGDPETQAILPRLDVDLVEWIGMAVAGRLDEMPARIPVKPETSCCVVVASANYPASSPTGLPIAGLDRVDPGVELFHAGTRREGDSYATAGGRVLSVTALGPDVTGAREKAYANVARIGFDGARYRRDIAANAVPVAAR